MFVWEAVLCIFYSTAALFVGCFLMRCVGMACENHGAITLPARLASAFLLGQGLLANVWLLIALAGWLNIWVVSLALCACLLLGFNATRAMRLPIHEKLQSLATEFRVVS